MALIQGKEIKSRTSQLLSIQVAAAVNIHKGAMVALEAGNAKAAYTATGLKIVGVAETSVDNTNGIAGEKTVNVKRGTYLFKNDGDITIQNINDDAYAVDDETVAATDGSGTRSRAGTIRDVDADGVWIEF